MASKMNDNIPMHPTLQQSSNMQSFSCKCQCTLPCERVHVRYYALMVVLQHDSATVF